jgi:hypothetical protein
MKKRKVGHRAHRPSAALRQYLFLVNKLNDSTKIKELIIQKQNGVSWYERESLPDPGVSKTKPLDARSGAA